MSCLEPDDLLNYKFRCQTVQLCCDEEAIQAALDAAQEVVESFTGQKYCPDETCIYLDGKGKRTLFLTEATSLPLTELNSVTILEYGKEDVEVDTEELHREDHTLRYRSGKCFPCGDRNIRVCGLFGIDLPEGVKSVILTLALESLQPGAAGIQPQGIDGATWEDFTIRYRVDKTFDVLRQTTGFTQLDKILMNYTNSFSQVMFGVVGGCKEKPCDDGCGSNRCS
jgi:hypothetical protein